MKYCPDTDNHGIIKLKNVSRIDLTNSMGIYDECDDAQVYPENYDKVSVLAFSIAGALLAILSLGLMVARREEA